MPLNIGVTEKHNDMQLERPLKSSLVSVMCIRIVFKKLTLAVEVLGTVEEVNASIEIKLFTVALLLNAEAISMRAEWTFLVGQKYRTDFFFQKGKKKKKKNIIL